jgi:DDE superfamily endonuclease/Archaeal putative transposase ISC1217
MAILPELARPLVQIFAPAFTRPTFKRFLTLMAGAILSTSRRTITNLLRAVRGLAPGHATSYHRVFSHRRWSTWTLARALAGTILRRWATDRPVPLAGDDTVDEHRGAKVYGKGRHRDPVRSTKSYTAWRWGHKWVVLAVLVKFPFATRPWALPVLVALYRTPDWDREHSRRHKTPARLLRQLTAVLLRWFPDRRFVLAGDGGFGSHEMARFAHRHRRRLTLISRFGPKANLYEPPPVVVGKRNGRPRKKGAKLPTPAVTVAGASRTPLEVAWYGGSRRDVEVVSGTGQWYKSGEGLVPVRWVFVHDVTGTHRDDYFFSTDVAMTPQALVETFTGRWSIETTFQEMRAYLGLETTRGRTEATVLRVAPCLFGLFSVVALLYELLPARTKSAAKVDWPGKVETTFSDAITATRRWLWVDWVFANHGFGDAFSKLPRAFRDALLSALAPTA